MYKQLSVEDPVLVVPPPEMSPIGKKSITDFKDMRKERKM